MDATNNRNNSVPSPSHSSRHLLSSSVFRHRFFRHLPVPSPAREKHCMPPKSRAFTLVELLIVVAILSIIAAIVFPVFARARWNARKTVSTSNLRQCGMALLIYCEDYDGLRSMPSYDKAKELLKGYPTCDPNDSWRTGCQQDWGRPLIGSYAYVRGIKRFDSEHQDAWEDYYVSPGGGWWGQKGSLLISIFYTESVPMPLHDEPPERSACVLAKHFGECDWAKDVLRFRLDGSCAFTHFKTIGMFDWEGLFFYTN